MSDGRKTKFKEPMRDVELPKMKLEVESEATPETPLTAEQIYLKRKAEVAQQDNEDFSDYLRQKASRDQQEKLQPAPVPPPAATPQTAPKKLNRRSLLTWAAGTAVVGEAVTLGYPMLTGQSIPDHGARHAGATYTEPQRHPIDRELVNPQADVGGRRFGDWVLLMPTRRHLCGEPQYWQSARLGLVLELRRLQPDFTSSVRVPKRGSGQGFRMDQ